MDPTANLQHQRRLSLEILRVWDQCRDDGTLSPEQAAHVAALANELAEHVEALDRWIRGGGFLPEPWRPR